MGVLPGTVLVAVTLASEQPSDEPVNVRRKIISRKVTPLGQSILRHLLGNRNSIRKSPYPYAERSFSSRSSAISSSLREQHERAFGSASKTELRDLVDRTHTNQLEEVRGEER